MTTDERTGGLAPLVANIDPSEARVSSGFPDTTRKTESLPAPLLVVPNGRSRCGSETLARRTERKLGAVGGREEKRLSRPAGRRVPAASTGRSAPEAARR